MPSSKCNTIVCPIICSSVGISFVIAAAAIISLGTVDQLITNMIAKQLVVSLDSPEFSQWMNPAPPIYMQYFFFNVTNPEEVISGKKPVVKQVGPLTYRLYQPRMDVSFFTNSTVAYKYNHTLVYDKKMSQILPTQPIIQLNLPLVTIDVLVREQKIPKVLADLIAAFVKQKKDNHLFVNHTAEEFLFGYDDPMFTFINSLGPFAGLVPDKFGLFYGFNNTDDGLYLVNTGRSDISKVNLLERWNNNKTLHWWGTDQSNMINGTDGVFMSAGVKKSDRLYIYNSDICRSIYVVFEKETEVRGIRTWRYRVPDAVFESPKTNKANQGFCIGYPNDCLLDGVMSIAPCQHGAPVVMSCPHFYMGDKSYIDAIDGMNPNKQNHETFLDVEPMTGAVFSAQKRLQVNALLQKSTLFDQLKNINVTLFPVAFLNESVYLDVATSTQFKTEVIRNINFVTSLQYVLLAIGLLMTIGTIIAMLAKNCSKKEGGWKALSVKNDDGNDDNNEADA